ncbi:protein NDRG3-like isoform X2 [Clavelina lepadiformis]|uniref:protein NDRG3-like isoform X2 n=1 Tax=Clavelina lepadiformis TaxID=159417 RepID=UPI00404312B4
MELQEVNITPEHPLLNSNHTHFEDNVVECSYIQGGTTHKTKLNVTIQGDKAKNHAMVTFHDIGLNSVSNFGPLMNSESMGPVTQKYCIYHIDAPGQEENAAKLPNGFVYPSMENLSDMMPKIFSHFGLKNAICIGCGAGANVFTRFALKNPGMVEGLILVNPTILPVGTVSWIGELITNFTTPISEQVLNYHLSKAEVDSVSQELVETHRKHFKQNMNEENVQTFWKEYERRREINLVRPIDPQMPDKTLQCQTMILVGDLSPFVDDAVEVNSRLNPTKTTFLKMADAGGMVLEEQIFKVAEAFTYFLQGLGHIPGVMMTRLARSRTISNSSTGSGDGDRKRVRTLSGGSADSSEALTTSKSAPGFTESSKQADMKKKAAQSSVSSSQLLKSGKRLTNRFSAPPPRG